MSCPEEFTTENTESTENCRGVGKWIADPPLNISAFSAFSVVNTLPRQLRVTVYCPQAVYSIVTVVVRSPRVATMTSVPSSNMGRTVHDAL